MAVIRCHCRCHRSIEAIPSPFYAGVDVRDPVAAVTACSLCMNAHCAALRDPDDLGYLPPKPYDPGDDEDQADGC